MLKENILLLEDVWGNFSAIAGFKFSSSNDSDNESFVPVEKFSFADKFVRLLSGLEVRNNMKIWFNNKGWISSVTYASVLNNAILRANLPAGAKPEDYGIITINHPMNYSLSQLKERQSYVFCSCVMLCSD